MDDIDPAVKSVHDYAAENETSPFDRILPEEPVKLSIQSKRIPYQTTAGTRRAITLKTKNKYHQIIFKASAAGFHSDWFIGISGRSKPSYFDQVRNYFNWLNELGHNTTDNARYDSLKAFEAYWLNERGIKNSPLVFINAVIREGLGCSTISDSDHDFLQTLLLLSKPAKRSEPESVTLSSWFDLPWLRAIIGEPAYLQLESPRQLFKSFRVTIATTLLYLLEQRQRWQKSSFLTFDTSRREWFYDWNPKLLERHVSLNNEGDPDDELSQLLWVDLVKPSGQEAVKAKLVENGPHKLGSKRLYYQKKNVYPWQKPVFFHPDFQMQYSPVEELLCAWLVACEAVQPTDISKLKTSNYAREHSVSGRLLAMQCTYHKGRSGSRKQPAILMGSDPWTRAMDRYMAGLSGPYLFKSRIAKVKKFPAFKFNNAVRLLYRAWRLPSFRQQLDCELQRREATPLFLDAMLALEQGNENYIQYHSRTGKSVSEYRASVPRPLPLDMFSLTHIKNTAVHAGTDAGNPHR